MENQQIIPYIPRQYGKQPISVPFLWEETPGVPKKDWKLSSVIDPFIGSPSLIPPSPIHLTISVPFDWEEKPGKPLNPSSWNPFIDDSFSEDSSVYHSVSESSSENGTGNDFLFPLTVPRSGFLDKVFGEDFSVARAGDGKRQLTLGELILLSRKLSYRPNNQFLYE